MRRRGSRVLGLRVLVVLAVLLPGAAVGAPDATAQPAVPGPETRSGTGPFAGLKITVSQTSDLINQVVRVSWEGGTPTGLLPVRSNFLQIFQCWGDNPVTGPKPSQCQFGGLAATSDNGESQVGTRLVQQLGESSIVPDPAETLEPSDDPDTPLNEKLFPAHVPFWPAGGAEPVRAAINNRNDYFDDQLTNEVPIARTGNDGKGEVPFEMQTVRQASGLACGEVPLDGSAGTPRPCWLVVVPRGATEPDGTTPSALRSSPLSASNWANRIQFPLSFLPVGRACPIGAVERGVIGHEPATDAVTRWQPALCRDGGTAFAYTQTTDDLARGNVVDGRPTLSIVSDPIPPDEVLPDRPVAYAPIALSGLVIAFSIESQPPDPADPASGTPFRQMKLTPRLVAKLLSQSYFESIEGFPAEKTQLQGNPRGLTDDPEFLAINPEYAGKDVTRRPADAMVQLGTADSTTLLWQWVLADADARAFLEGTPDPNGMKVNPVNRIGAGSPVVLPAATFPRNDATCSNVDALGAKLRTCTLDSHPFANDMHEAGRAAARGDTLGRVAAPPEPASPQIPRFSRTPRQGLGQRSVLAVVDAATAARYGLDTAALRNASGAFVTPDVAGLTAGAAAMLPARVGDVEVPGVLRADVTTSAAAAYPLPLLSYAVTAPANLEPAVGAQYAAFVRYAVGDGQVPGIGPGQLPAGYAPLPAGLRAQGTAAADRIAAGAVAPPAPETTGGGSTTTGGGITPGGSTTAGGAPATSSPGAFATGAAGGAAAGTAAGAAPGAGGSGAGALAAPPAAAAAPALPGDPQAVAVTQPTPPSPVWGVGSLLGALLIAGGLAAASAPVAHLASTGRLRGGDATDRTEPRNTFPWATARPAFAARRR